MPLSSPGRSISGLCPESEISGVPVKSLIAHIIGDLGKTDIARFRECICESKVTVWDMIPYYLIVNLKCTVIAEDNVAFFLYVSLKSGGSGDQFECGTRLIVGADTSVLTLCERVVQRHIGVE